MKKLVSIITCTLNSEKYLQKCIDSVRLQNYGNKQHLFIDGGSTDDTLEILKRNNCEFISESDRGIYDAFSKGIKLAKGEIIHILNSDDYYINNNVISMVYDKMNDNNLDLCHSQVAHIDSQGKIVNVIGRDATISQLRYKMNVAHPSVFIKKTVYNKFGTFSEGFQLAGDHEYLLRIWNKISIGFIPSITVNMLIGGASMSNTKKSMRECCAATILHGLNPFSAAIYYYLHLVTFYIFFKRRYAKK